jgi:hypothetical protein
MLICGAFDQHESGCRPAMVYEDHNQVDPPPLTMARISGTVQDREQGPIPGACVGLFREADHKLVAQGVTDEKGHFDLGSTSPGRYRLVARYDSFCPPNTPIRLVRRGAGRRAAHTRVVVHMAPHGLDDCSYIGYR